MKSPDMTRFMPASRTKAKARIALNGPSGSGKTLSALKLLYALTGSVTVADGMQRIAAVDTERDTMDKYAANLELPGVREMTPEQAGGYGFAKVSPIRYDPAELIEYIDEAAEAGFPALLVDSLSHYWFGPGGMLDIVDMETRRHGGRSMDGWREARPRERAYIEALMAYPGHVIVCMRAKQKYEVREGGDGGKAKVTKLGLQPEQRDGIEFEFDLVGDLDMDHHLTVTKARSEALADMVWHKPGADLALQVLDWLEYGEPPKDLDWDKQLAAATSRQDLAKLWQRAQRLGKTQKLRAAFNQRGAEISAARGTAESVALDKAAVDAAQAGEAAA